MRVMCAKKQNPDPRKAIVTISLRFASSRDVLMGLFRHIESSSNWAINLMQPEDNPLTVAKLHAAERDGTNAIVITEPCSNELMLALAETPIPVASIGIKDAHLKSRKGTMVFVHNDNAAIGDMGARHFFSLGRFNSYGFVLAGPDDDWARERSDAFCARIAASAPNAEVRVFPATADSGLEANIGALVNWIRALPKPAAIMAACDIRAIEVLDACGRAGVSVPNAVAVLGVDNDELLCAHASTPLSSILPGHVEMGRITAETLEKMARQKSTPRQHRIVTVPPSKVVERESTHLRAPSAVLVDRARHFIQECATDGICVQDVASHLRVSRRLAEMRWRDATGGTIRAAIEDVRMAKLTKLLGSTRQPIAAIAAECGWHNADALSRAFQKRFGMSMREWRAKRHEARSL